MITLNLLSLLLISILIISFFKNKIIRIILSILFSSFFCLQTSALFLNSSFINYQYYFHFSINSLQMADGFVKQIILISLLFIIPALIFYFLPPVLNKFLFPKNKPLQYSIKGIFILLSFLAIILSKNGIYEGLKEIYIIKNFKSNSITTFADKSKLEVNCKGKNIVIISLESFDYAFLHEANKELTPNLRKRMESWSFYKMKPNEGSSWTAASLYTVFTGLPAFLPGHGNDFFVDAKESKLITIGDILKKCNYDMYHLSVYAGFAGTEDLLTTFGVEKSHILSGSFNGKYEGLVWGGASDKNIINEAKEVIKQRHENPFMVYITTTQTHSPDGFVDPEMLQYIEKKDDDLETAVLSTDWLVEDFINFLQDEDLLDNTIVYIFPDHLYYTPGNKKVLNKINEERSLWFMSNANSRDLPVDTENFYQVDIAKLILSGAGIEHNAIFFFDPITENKDNYIRENKSLISAINASSIIREQTISSSVSVYLEEELLSCKINGQDTLFSIHKDIIGNKHIVIALNEQLKILSTEELVEKTLLSESFSDNKNIYINIYLENDNINLEWIKNNSPVYSTKAKKMIALNSKDIIEIINN